MDVITSNILGLSQSVEVVHVNNLGGFVTYVSAHNTLTLVQKLRNLNQTASNTLVLNQTVTVGHPKNVSASNILALTQKAQKVIDVVAGNFVPLSQQTGHPKVVDVHQTLNLTQIVSVSRGLFSQLNLVQTVDVKKTINLNINQVLSINSNSSCSKENDPKFVSINVQPAVKQDVKFAYQNTLLTFRAPEFDNVDSIELARINRNSRAGDLIIGRAPYWPVTEKLKMHFIELSQQKCKDLINFFDLTLGLDIIFTDHEGQKWRGIILNPESAVTQEGRNDQGCGGFAVDIEFQGSKISQALDLVASNTLVLTQSALNLDDYLMLENSEFYWLEDGVSLIQLEV